MTASIPASAIVDVFPDVLSAGGTGLELCGLFLTRNPRVPLGTVASFASAAAVESYFGIGTPEANFSTTYFGSFRGSQIQPAKLSMASYPSAATGAFLRGGRVSTLGLAGLQALSGVLSVTVDDRPVVSSAIDFAATASFSAAATLIETGLDDFAAEVTGEITGDELTVSAVSAGELALGQILQGAGIAAGTKIVAFGTGTGGTGTYTVNITQTAVSTAIGAGKTTVAYDSVSGAFVISSGTPGAGGSISYAGGSLAAPLALTEATAAVLSPGGDALAPGAAMAAVAAFTQDFVSFGTIFETTLQEKLAFAEWTNGKKNRFLYLMADTDTAATVAGNTSNAGVQIRELAYSGTMPIFAPVNAIQISAFVSGAIASIDFDRENGRTNIAFRRQDSIVPGVVDELVSEALIANGYNFYGAYATANDRFLFLYPGQVTGPYLWVDSFVNQVWLSNKFQLELLELLQNVRSIPYTPAGRAIIEQAIAGPIDDALSFGAIRPGVTLSNSQIVAINSEAGFEIDQVVSQRGWYLLVGDASPAVRAARGSPPIRFWYTDGQSVQRIALNSIQVQ